MINKSKPRKTAFFCCLVSIIIFLETQAAERTYNETWTPPTLTCRQAWQYDSRSKGVKNPRDIYQFSRDKYPKDSRDPLKAYQDYTQDLKRLGVERKKCLKKWTILVAMDADNDLMPYSLWDLMEMESGFESETSASNLRLDVIAQHDGKDEDGIHRLHVFQGKVIKKAESHKLCERKKSDFENKKVIEFVQSPLVSQYPEGFAGSKLSRFKDFLLWGMQNYPAENYVVVLWGHGKGWLQNDNNPLIHLRSQDLAAALKEVHESPAGLNGRKKIDNFIADTCFMQGIELAKEISPHVRFVSGSAQVQTYLGLPYRTLFTQFNHNFMHINDFIGENQRVSSKGDLPANLAEVVPLKVQQSLASNGCQGRMDKESDDFNRGKNFFTYTSLDSEKVDDFAQSFSNLSEQLVDWLDASSLVRIRRKGILEQHLIAGGIFNSEINTRELGAFLFSLAHMDAHDSITKSVTLQANRTLTKFRQSVVNEVHSPGYDKIFSGFSGVAFWVPSSNKDWQENGPVFENSSFHKETYWPKLLESLYKE